MADVKDIIPHLDKLDVQLDRLEDALSPLLNNLNERASQLPLLDKAKLFSLTAYSIESLLFSYLRLQGADAQNHAVYIELKRVQQYFGKIKAVEEPEGTRTLVVNQEAAARILKADLAGNKTLSNKLAEKISEERAKALLRSVEGKKRPADDSGASAAEGGEGQGSSRKRRQKGKGRGKKR
ncbi:hypothetical protein C2857_002513 [Epichloe festucae Fl1]|uniref:Exosome complex protein n=1 Tax=Epichloe festucae (strain Fl1) TaxID=877507 RepID=A0A7U3Q2V6_EPIFF|nr:hypothetical protein C2857_002513 [Epichloe festucae Fl1]